VEEKTDYYGRRAQIEHPTRTAVHIRVVRTTLLRALTAETGHQRT
jgi:hypothetical protein